MSKELVPPPPMARVLPAEYVDGTGKQYRSRQEVRAAAAKMFGNAIQAVYESAIADLKSEEAAVRHRAREQILLYAIGKPEAPPASLDEEATKERLAAAFGRIKNKLDPEIYGQILDALS